jgi:cell wall-associated NlpC family hydrolase
MKPSEKIIAIALQEVGNTENPPNSNHTKYGEWFGWQGVPWCAIFVSWCYDRAEVPLGNIGFSHGFAGCQSGFDHWTKSGEITQHPQPGDIVLFDWNGDKRFDHTGIYKRDLGVSKDGPIFESIEGNTSFSNNSNGGEVMVRQRNYKNCVFIHPKILDKKL